MRSILYGIIVLGVSIAIAKPTWPSNRDVLRIVFNACGFEFELSPECKLDKKLSRVLANNNLLISFECIEEISGKYYGSFEYVVEDKQALKNTISCN